MERGQRQQALHGCAVLAAEPAPQAGAGDADPVERDTQGIADLEPVPERGLGGYGHGDAAVLLQPRRPVFRFEKDMGLHRGGELPLHHRVALREGGRGVALADLGRHQQVVFPVRMQPRSAFRQGRLGIEDGRKRFDNRRAPAGSPASAPRASRPVSAPSRHRCSGSHRRPAPACPCG